MSLTFHSSLINNFSDIIGGVNGTPANITWKSTNRGLKPELNGADAKITYGDIGTVKSIAMWVHLRSTTESILDLNGTQTIDISSGTVRGNSWTSPTVYVDGVATASLSDLTGYHQIIITTATGIAASAVVAGLMSAAYGKLIVDDIRGYDNELSSAETLALYNATSGEYGVRIAEFSHQHDPAAVIPITADTVLQIGGKLAGDAVDTISDRALSNDAEIHGPMPTGDGFLAGGRRFVAANENYLDCGNVENVNTFSYECCFSIGANFIGYPNIGGKNSNGSWAFRGWSGSSKLIVTVVTSGKDQLDFTTGIDLNKFYHMIISYDGTTIGAWINGILTYSKIHIYGGNVNSDSHSFAIGKRDAFDDFAEMIFQYGVYRDSPVTNETAQTFFNTIAVLPFWSINYRDYPDNVTTYTDRFPHSSTIIASGSFKVDDDKIQCTSAGTLTYSASNEFDGAEYITVTIAGTEYSGTGTITQGNTTVSVAQGSNKITVAMGTGDTIDKIKIQFRATV